MAASPNVGAARVQKKSLFIQHTFARDPFSEVYYNRAYFLTRAQYGTDSVTYSESFSVNEYISRRKI